MKILIVTNMYPGHNPRRPHTGIFVKEQVDALSVDATVDVLVIEGFRGFFSYATGFLRAWRASLSSKHDIIHAHYGLTAAFALFLPKKARRRVVVTLHGGDVLEAQGRKIQNAITRLAISRVGLVICVSEEIATVAKKYAKWTEVIPCGVDDQFFVPSSDPSISTPFKIIFPGDPERSVKNFSLYQDAMASFGRLCGPASAIVLHNLTRNQVLSAMQSSSALLLTSISEGSPQVVKEALACDIAVVCSDVGDVRKLLGTAPGTGIFPKGTAPDAIAMLLNSCITERFLNHGLRRVRVRASGVSQQQVAQRILNIYDRVAGRETFHQINMQ